MITALGDDPGQVGPGRGRGPQAGARRGRDTCTTCAERLLDGLGVRRGVVRAPRPLRRLAAGRPAERVRAAAREAVHRAVGGADLRHPQARRRLQRRGGLARPVAAGRDGPGSNRRTPRTSRRRTGPSTSARPSTTPSRASSTSPGICRRRAGSAGRADMLDELAELIEAAGGRTLGLFSSMRAPRRRPRRCASRLDHPILLQGEETLGELIRTFAARRRDLPVRHAVALAGRRCAGAQLPVGGDGPDPVPAARRSADERPAEGGGGARRQRLHGGRGHPRRAADGAGRGPADPGDGRPRRGRGARPAAGHRPLRQLPAVVDARTSGTPRTATRCAARWRRSTPRRRPDRGRVGRHGGLGCRTRTTAPPAPVRRRVPGRRRYRRAARQTRRSTATTLPRMVASSPGIGW